MRHFVLSSFLLAALASVASAHVSITSGPAFADKSVKLTFGVGHGCHITTPQGEVEADTYRVRIEIPAGVTGVRVLSSDFGKPSVEKNAQGAVVAVSWQKSLADLQDSDIQYYDLQIRARMPAAPFTTIDWKVHQTCRTATGLEQTVSWQDPPGTPDGNPVAQLVVVPARIAGWNKVTLPIAIAESDYARYFADAQIVWRGSAAYSSNPHTAAQIAATSGVSPLSGNLAAGDELWVKY